MTDTTNNFYPIPRLQQIAATIEESGAGISNLSAVVFDAPATAVHYIRCAIKEIERLRAEAETLQAGWRLARIKADAIEAMGFRWEWLRTVGPDGEQEGGWVEAEPKRGCARDQKATQFCREAVEADAALADCRAALKRIERERDDARLRYCHDVWQGVGDEDEQRQLTPREIAARMGWKYPEGT